jgi:DUF4097 and DUF4098 domain-containing protein YvlB
MILIVVGLLWLAFELVGSKLGAANNLAEVFPSSSQAVVFDLGRGDLQIEVEERDDIVVSVTQSGFWGGNALLSEQDNGQLRISNALGFCLVRCSVSYQVSMPAHTQLDVRTSSGEVMLHGEFGPTRIATSSGNIGVFNITAPLEVSTSSGNVDLENIDANIVLQATSGDITLDTLRGDTVQISTTSGNIELDDLNANTVQLQSSSGDMSFAGSTAQLNAKSTSGNIEIDNDRAGQLTLQSTSGNIAYEGDLIGDNSIESTSGNVELELSNPQDLSVSVSTRSGSINNSLPLDAIKDTDSELHGAIGVGLHTLTIKTTSGDIDLGE